MKRLQPLAIALAILLVVMTPALAQDATSEPAAEATPFVVTIEIPPFTADDLAEDTIPPGLQPVLTLSLTVFMATEAIKLLILTPLKIEAKVTPAMWKAINFVTAMLFSAVLVFAAVDRPNIISITGLYPDANPLIGEIVTALAIGGGNSFVWALYRIASKKPMIVLNGQAAAGSLPHR